MSKKNKINFQLKNSEIINAFLFIANELRLKESSIITKKRVLKIQNKSVILLIKVIMYLISTNNNVHNDNTFNSFCNQLPAELIKTCPIILDYNEFIDVNKFMKNNNSFNYLTRNSVEEIGNVYDILQSYNLYEVNNLLALDINNNKNLTGSFYTPIAIVDFIIKNTFGRYIDSIIGEFNAKKQTNCETIRSDIINKILKIKIIDPSAGGGIFLIRTIKYFEIKLKNILTNHNKSKLNKFIERFINDCIFGIDIDPIAVEVTIISLYLLTPKSNNYSISQNIFCADALSLLNSSKTNSSKTENITKLISQSANGFDLIISNPPYQFGENIPNSTRELKNNYKLAAGQFDVYWLFYELAFRKLLRDDGYHGYIIPDSILTRNDSFILRKKLFELTIYDIWHVGSIFSLPNVSSVVIICQKRQPTLSHNINIIDKYDNEWRNKQQNYSFYHKNRFLIYVKNDTYFQITKKLMKNSLKLVDVANICRGEEFGKKILCSSCLNKIGVLSGKQITPYKIIEPTLYLNNFNKHIKKNIYKGKKILIRKTGSDLIAAIDESDTIFLQSVYSLKIKNNLQSNSSDDLLKVLLGFLNSRLINFYIYHTFTAYKLVYPQLNQTTILEIPLPDNFIENDWQKLINAVNNCINCNIHAIDKYLKEIDSIVYSTYKLNKKECILVNEYQTRLTFKR